MSFASPPKRRGAAALALVVAAASAGAALLSQPAHAERTVARDNGLFLVEGRSAKRLPAPGAVSAVFAEDNGTVLFGVQRDAGTPHSEHVGTADLYLSQSDLRAPVRLAGPVTHAALDLPRKLAYYVTPTAELRRVALDGGNDAHVADRVLSPAVSPDSTRMLYQKLPADWQPGQYADRALGLHVLDLASGNERRLTSAWQDFAATWSPDGATVMYSSANEHGLASLFTVPASGGTRQQLTNIGHDRVRPDTVPVPSEQPEWSPDGRSLAFESDKEIWLAELGAAPGAAATARRLSFGREPRWNPDGRSLTVLVGSASDAGASVVTVDTHGRITP
jgi:hypothetical protein